MSKVYISIQFFGKLLVIGKFFPIVTGNGQGLSPVRCQHLNDCHSSSRSCALINLLLRQYKQFFQSLATRYRRMRDLHTFEGREIRGLQIPG